MLGMWGSLGRWGIGESANLGGSRVDQCVAMLFETFGELLKPHPDRRFVEIALAHRH